MCAGEQVGACAVWMRGWGARDLWHTSVARLCVAYSVACRVTREVHCISRGTYRRRGSCPSKCTGYALLHDVHQRTWSHLSSCRHPAPGPPAYSPVLVGLATDNSERDVEALGLNLRE